jgi:hypothetical protein
MLSRRGKRMPVRMGLVMDQRKLNSFLSMRNSQRLKFDKCDSTNQVAEARGDSLGESNFGPSSSGGPGVYLREVGIIVPGPQAGWWAG